MRGSVFIAFITCCKNDQEKCVSLALYSFPAAWHYTVYPISGFASGSAEMGICASDRSAKLNKN